MQRHFRLLPAIVAAQLLGLTGLAAEPPARIAAFLADAEGRQTHDFPAWNDYRKAIGDGPVARALFADMLKAEPDLCDAVGGAPDRLNDLLTQRLHTLAPRVKDGRELYAQRWPNWSVTKSKGGSKNPENAGGDACVALGSVVAVVFVAARPDLATLFADDEEVFILLAGSSELLLDNEAVVVYTGNTREKQTRKVTRRWNKPDPRFRAVQQVVARWITRKSDPKWLASRFAAAGQLGLDEAKLSLAVQILQCPELRRLRPGRHEGPVTERAIMAVGQLGDKSHSLALAPYLEQTRKLDWSFSVGFTFTDIDKQLRDLALSTLVKLHGVDPQRYGFHLVKVHDEKQSVVYLFKTVEERNRGFAMCVQNYKELGLERPPQFTPETVPRFVFMPLSESREMTVTPLPTSPDGKIRLKLDGGSAVLIDAATGRQIGKTLEAGSAHDEGREPFTFNCWSFSPDGKYVVTGAGYLKRYPPHEDTVDTNVGRIEVWDAATGEPLARQPANRVLGRIRSVGFQSDGKTILFIAEHHSRDIS